MLFCLASDTDWERAGATHATTQHLLLGGIIDRTSRAARFKLTTVGPRRARRVAQDAGRRTGWMRTRDG